MRPYKRLISVILAFLPIIYCAYLVHYFYFEVDGSTQGVVDTGLGPTVIGLSIVGMLFVIPLIFKIIRLLNRQD